MTPLYPVRSPASAVTDGETQMPVREPPGQVQCCSPRQGCNYTLVPHQTSVSVMAPRWLAGPPRPAPCDGSCCSAAAYAGMWAGPLGRRASCGLVLSQGVFCFLTAVQKAHSSMRASLPFYGRKMNCLPSSGAER